VDHLGAQIDKVDWGSLQAGDWGEKLRQYLHKLIALDAYSATDPEYLRHLICSIIAHQGDVTEITIATIPLLLDFLKSQEITNKRWILGCLACIWFSDPDKDEMHNQVYKLMYPQRELFRKFLGSRSDDEVRLSAKVLSNFVLHPDPVAKWICDAIKSATTYRQDLFGGLGFLLTNTKKEISPVLSGYILSEIREYLNASDYIDQMEAAIICFMLGDEKTDERVFKNLRTFITGYDSSDDAKLIARVHLMRALESSKHDDIESLIPELSPEQIQAFLYPAML
jgi:hypothetical protein